MDDAQGRVRAVIVAPMLGVDDVVAVQPAAQIAHLRVDRFKAALELDMLDIAVRHPLGHRIRRSYRDPRWRGGSGKRLGGIPFGGEFGVELEVFAFAPPITATDQTGDDRWQHRRTDQRGDRGPQAKIGDYRRVDDRTLSRRQFRTIGQSSGAGITAGHIRYGDWGVQNSGSTDFTIRM